MLTQLVATSFLLLTIEAQWNMPFNNRCAFCPPIPYFGPQFFPGMPPFHSMMFPPMSNGMGSYVSTSHSGSGGGAGAFASSSSGGGSGGHFFTSTSSNGGPPVFTATYGPYGPAPGILLPSRPGSGGNTVVQESEKRTKLPGGGEMITKTMVEKSPNGQSVSTFSYSQNSLGPIIPFPRKDIPSGKLPYSQKDRNDDYKLPSVLDEPSSKNVETYVREGSGEIASGGSVSTPTGNASALSSAGVSST